MPVPIVLTLELQPGADPFQGAARLADGTSRAFVGVLELVRVLADAATSSNDISEETR